MNEKLIIEPDRTPPAARLTAEQYSAMADRCAANATDPKKGGVLQRTTFIAAGTLNAFVCDLCREITVAIVRDAGVAPFRLPCANPKHGPEPQPPPDLSPRKCRRLIQLTDGTFFSRPDLKRMPDGRPITLRSVNYAVANLFKESDAKIELYRPPFDEYAALPNGQTANHISNGGLWFRDVGALEGDGLAAMAGTERNE